MKPYCEVVVSNVLPAMRALIANKLLNKYGLTQKEAAELLGLTQPALSQYVQESRGFKTKLLKENPKIMKMIDDLAEDIASGKNDPKEMQFRICEICKAIRKSKLICSMHEKIYPAIAPASICPDL